MRASWTRFLVVVFAISAAGAAAFPDEPDVPQVLKPGEAAKRLEQPLAAVEFEGNKQTASAELQKLIAARAGRVVSLADVSADVTKLMDTGRYADVTPEVRKSDRGPVLFFVLEERAIEKSVVMQVTFSGNARLSERHLRGIVQTRPQVLGFSDGHYDSDLVDADVRGIMHAYRELGFNSCRVTVQREFSADRSEVQIRFVIDEGEQLQVGAFRIEGNASIPADTLRAAAKLKEGAFAGERAFQDGAKAIEAHYRNAGYLFARVDYRLDFPKHEKSRPDAANYQVQVVYEVEENHYERKRLRFGKVRIEGNRSLQSDQLRDGTKLQPDELFDERTLMADLATLRARYRDAGRGKVAITPRVERGPRFDLPSEPEAGVFDLPSEPGTGVFDLTLVIDEGPLPVTRTIGERLLPWRSKTPPPSAAAAPPEARLIERIRFDGVTSFDLPDFRYALESDFDLMLAAHPGKDLADYLTALQKTILLGYRHNGFPDATVTCQFNRAQERIEVGVKEGAQLRCGEILVTGARRVSNDEILRGVTDDSKPQLTLWKEGKPASFDDETMDEIRKRIDKVYASAGCFSPEVEIKVRKGTKGKLATLAVTIRDEGPLTVAGEVQVTGANRDSAAEIVKRLAIERDMPFGSELASRLATRLRETGRYLSVSIKRGESAAAGKGRLTQSVLVSVVEYDKAPPLAAELSPVEEAVLKLGQWTERWSRGEIDEDFVLSTTVNRAKLDELTFGSGDGPPGPELRASLRMVIGPDRGWVLTGKATGPGGKRILDLAFVVDGNQIVLADLERRTKVEVRDCLRSQVILDITADSSGKSQDAKQPFRLMLGAGIRSKRKPDSSPFFKVKTQLSAASLLNLLYWDGMHSEIRDGVCELRMPGSELKIDVASGRLIEARWDGDDGDGAFSLRAEHGALERELQRLEKPLAASAVAYDPESPWASFGAFLLEQSAHFFERTGEIETAQSLAAFHKFLRGSRLPDLAELFDVSSENSASDENWFRLPTNRHGFTLDDFFFPGSRSRKNFAAMMLFGWQRFVPPGSWLAPLGRDALENWVASDPVPGQALRRAVDAPGAGPAEELLLSWLPSILAVDLQKAAGEAGLHRLSAADFARDYTPLLSNDSRASRLFVALAESLRQLDEGELRALLRLLPASAPQERIARALLPLRARSNVPVQKLLPGVLDRLWTDVLRESFETAFSRLAGPETPRTGPIERVEHVRPGNTLR